MRVLVTGSRDWPREADVTTALNRCLAWAGGEGLTVVHGDCPTGADAMARRWCMDHLEAGDPVGLVVMEAHPAQWRKAGNVYDRGAGFRRNAEMVAAGADLVLAFCKDQSRGTMHTVRLAEKAGLRVEVFTA